MSSLLVSLKQPYNMAKEMLEELTFSELNKLLEDHIDQEKNNYEMIAVAVRVGYYNAKQGKDQKLFENAKKVGEISREEKENDLNYLKGKFKGG